MSDSPFAPELQDEASYLTDDRDRDHKATSIVYTAGNGDYYQQIVWEAGGKRCLSPSVRFCTSGGVASNNPNLLFSIVDQFRAMQGAETTKQRVEEQRDKAMEMLQKILDGEVSREEVENFLVFNRI